MSADWARQVIWWHVYPLGFLGAEARVDDAPAEPQPRLRDLLPWVDYLVELGANGLALGPVFASETHGYDTLDHFRVDPRLGTEDDLVALVEACHARGVRVLLDGVFNHVGRGFPPLQDLLARGAGSPYAGWFVREDGGALRTFEGHPGLVALNHDDAEVADHVTRVMTYWCDRGVDAWRLDAAYAVPPAFWHAVLPHVRERHPDVWVVGEMIHGDYAGYVTASGIDSVTQYELWKAVWSSLNDRNLFELAHALGRHAAMLPTFLPLTFVGNHDVTRLATRLDDPRHMAHALAVLFSVPGVPSVYYGDEQGLRGEKEERAGGDDAVRPAYPPEPGGLAPSGEQQTYDLHRRLVALRRRHPWVNDATVLEPDVLADEVVAFRVADGTHQLGVVLSLADSPAEVSLPLPGAVLVGGDAGVRQGRHEVVVTVPPHAYAVVGA